MSSVLEQPGAAPADATTSAGAALIDRTPRLVGVDVARGLALLGMFAAHVFDTLDDNGDPTLAHVLAGGRGATTFVLVAGVSLAFLSGGRRRVHGPDRVAASAGLAVRAALVGAIGLALGYLGDANGIHGILPFYAVLFLLAIPLLGAAPAVLIGIAAATAALGPVVLVATADTELPGSGAEPTFSTLVREPAGVLTTLFLTGSYPVVVYLAYLCVGLAIGRLDLRSPRPAWVLLGGGAALALAARIVSAVLLYPLGGLDRLIEQDGLAGDPADVSALIWEPEESSSWWYLALPAPHSHTPIDLLHTLGSAAVVLGAALLLTRIPAVGRALSPLAAAGAMSLTLYSAHLILLATGVLEDRPALLFPAMVVGALAAAWLWRTCCGQGPLEAVVAKPATAARRWLQAAMRHRRPGTYAGPRARTETSNGLPAVRTTARRGVQVLALVAYAGVLVLCFWVGTRLAVATKDVAAEVSDAARYCELSDQLYTLYDAHPDRPAVVVETGGALLSEMPQAAPSEIRDAVTVVVDDLRAEAGVPGVLAPDDATLTRAEATVEAFEDENC